MGEKKKKEERSWLISNIASSFSFTALILLDQKYIQKLCSLLEEYFINQKRNTYDFVWRINVYVCQKNPLSFEREND